MKYLKFFNSIYNKLELIKKIKFYNYINFLNNNNNEVA